MTRPPRLWVELVSPASLLASVDPTQPNSTGRRTGRDRAVDAAGCILAAALGALFISPTLHDSVDPLSSHAAGRRRRLRVCWPASPLWWRRRWPVGVALVCLLLGTVSISATPAGLLALFSLAVHRPARPTLLVAALWIPSRAGLRRLQPDDRPVSVVLVRVIPLVFAATAWGMFIRARRQLLLTLRERALRAEADQRLHDERARMAERTRIAREMHDVLGPPDLAAGAARRRARGPARPATGAGAGDRRAAALHGPSGTRGAARRDRGAARGRRARSRRRRRRSRRCRTSRRLVEETRGPARTSTSRCRWSTPTPCRARWDATPTASCRRR